MAWGKKIEDKTVKFLNLSKILNPTLKCHVYMIGYSPSLKGEKMYKLYSLFLIVLLSFQAMAMKKYDKPAFLLLSSEIQEKIFTHLFDLEPGKILVNLLKIKLITKEFNKLSNYMSLKCNPFMKDGDSFYIDHFYSSTEEVEHISKHNEWLKFTIYVKFYRKSNRRQRGDKGQ